MIIKKFQGKTKDEAIELAKQENFDDILVCYSCANFLTDTNLMLLG